MHFKCLVSVLICTFLVFGCSKSSSRKDKTGGDPKDFKERRVPRENAMISRGVGVRSNVDLMSNPPNRNIQDDAVLNLVSKIMQEIMYILGRILIRRRLVLALLKVF